MTEETGETSAETAQPKGKRFRPLRWVLGIILALAALVVAGIVFLNSSTGKRLIADQIAQVAPASGLRFEVGRIEGDIFGAAELYDVVVFDPKGEFLRISEVELDWSPISWITSGLDVETLIARRGTLQRLPELLPGDPDAPILPDFDIRIGEFEIDRLTLAPGLVDENAHVVNMTAQADIRSGRVYLKANAELGEEDRIALLVDAEPDGDVFDLEMDYQAPAGGVLAGLIGTPSDFRARLTGDGTWSQWDGTLFAEQDDNRLAAFKVTNSDGVFGLKGQAYPGTNLTGIPASALGDAVSIGASGTLEDSVVTGAMTVIGRAVRAKGQGTIDLANNLFDNFAVEAAITDPAIIGGSTRFVNARADAVLDGAFQDLSIAHTLTLNELVAGETVISGIAQSGTATFDGSRWVLPIDASVGAIKTGVALADPKLVGGKINGTLTYSGSQLQSDALRIIFPDASAELGLRGNLDAGTYQLAGPVDVNGLAFENIGVVSGDGRIDLQVRDTGVWALKSAFSARIPQVTNETLANLAGPDIRTQGSFSIGSASPLDFRNVSLNAEKLTLNIDGSVNQGTTAAVGRGRHQDYGDFTIEGSLGDDGPTAALVFANPLPAAGLEDVRVAIRPSETGFAIETEGQSLLGEFAGVLGLTVPDDGPTVLNIETLDIWKTSVSGDLTLGNGGADGALILSGGGLDGKIGLVTRGGGQGFAFDVDANRASFGGATPLSIARADFEGSGFLIDGNSTINANGTAEGLSYGSLFIGRMAAAAELQNGSGTATASLAGRRGGRFNLQLNADISPNRFAIATRGEFGGKTIRMPRRAVLTRLDNGGWALERTLLQYGDGAVLVAGEFGGARTSVQLALDKLSLSLVDLAVADFGLGGTISGEIDFVSAAGRVPTGNARIKVDGLTRSGFVLSSRPIDLALVSDLSANEMELRAVIDEGGKRRGRLQARISNLRSGGGLVDRLRTGNLLAQLRFNGPAAALWRLAAIEAFDLTGPMTVAANVSGSIANPSVRGSLASDNLRVQSSLSGTDVREITARGSFNGSRLRLTRFAGTASNGGTVSGSGIIDLRDLGPKGPELDIRVSAKNAQLLNANGLNATITGPLRIISDGVTGTIAGRLEIDRAAWTLATADEAVALPQIPTTEINIPADIAPPTVRPQTWRYLIDARARSRVDVDGMGLDSEWQANIQLRGTTADPRIGGQARVIRGSYSFAGTRFELTRGRINFDANMPIDPRLDIVAETDRNGVDISVSVQGNALQPEITFSSVPLLPEEEILARLLFGGSISELSATDALQLGAALASLRGGAGMDPINQLRSAIGLDRLRIVSADPALNRGTGVAIGKNLGRRFYVELITDGRGYSATEAEFRITGWLSLLGSISTIGRESVVAEISRDY